MDSLIAASARALAAGDPLGALSRVALRDDPPALALRGIAMAQLGDHPRARNLLRRAARSFGAHEAVARARCIVADAEVALASRDLGGSTRPLVEAAATLAAHGDRANALQARLIAARRLLLLGRLAEAGAALDGTGTPDAPPTLAAVAAMASAELALRSMRLLDARTALDRAARAAERSGIGALAAEVAEARGALDRPAARRTRGDHAEPLRLTDVAELLATGTLVVDACRHGVHAGGQWRPLARRPVLFTLLRGLAAAWPGEADRDALIRQAFRARDPDETHRARLRVELGRLRRVVAGLATVHATARGFALAAADDRPVALLVPPIDGDSGALLALLADGVPWSTSALALAVGESQRTVQRDLATLQAKGQVRSMGRARAQRWLAAPLAGFTTILLLPTSLPPA